MNIVETLKRGQLDDGFHLAFEQDRQHDDIHRSRFPERGSDLNVFPGHFRQQDPLLFERSLPNQALTSADSRNDVLSGIEGVAGQQPEIGLTFGGVIYIEDPVLDACQRREFRKNELRNCQQIALALQQSSESGQVGFEPVLLGVSFGGLAQVANHFIEVVFEGRDFACGVHCDGS